MSLKHKLNFGKLSVEHDLGTIKDDVSGYEEQKTLVRDHDNDHFKESSKEIIFYTVWTIRIIGISIAAMLITIAWHLIMPEDWKWLNTEQFLSINKTIASGGIGAIVASYFKLLVPKYFNESHSNPTVN